MLSGITACLSLTLKSDEIKSVREKLSCNDHLFLLGSLEFASSLVKPVLVMRDVTERTEALKAGTVQLIGTDTDETVKQVNLLLDNSLFWKSLNQIHNHLW